MKKDSASRILILIILMFCTKAHAGISVGDLMYEKSSRAGSSYQGSVLISNNGDEPQEAKLYQTDYLYSFDGRNHYGDPGKDPRSNAAWITFSPKRVVIPAGGRATVNYTVSVPEDRALKGTYWSMLMVEGIPQGSPESSIPEKGKVNVGLQTVVRYGLQLVTNIGESGVTSVRFLDQKLFEDKGAVILQVDIENTGERGVRPSLWAELYDGEGRYVGKFEGGRQRIYPGTSVRYRLPLSGIPRGRYKALVVSDCGGEHVFGGVFTLNLQR